jgi:gentisate 1,2-dioxygenase
MPKHPAALPKFTHVTTKKVLQNVSMPCARNDYDTSVVKFNNPKDGLMAQCSFIG